MSSVTYKTKPERPHQLQYSGKNFICIETKVFRNTWDTTVRYSTINSQREGGGGERERERWTLLLTPADRKTANYADLVQQARGNGYRATLLTLQVGSRGVPHYQSFAALAESWIWPTGTSWLSSPTLPRQPYRGHSRSGVPETKHVSLCSFSVL